MPNLSQGKRQRMLAFLDKIRSEHTDDASLIAINEIETELTNKKYGLVWEEHEERVDVELEENIPVFTEVVSREIVSDEDLPYHFLLEGDNLHSLKLLKKTHKGRIDVIYIDPPYNTEHSLKYDDTRIGKEDAFRHSKWLSFMSARLRIAKELLAKTGVIFLSIDDNEDGQLRLLCDEIFDEKNFIGEFSVIKAEGGGMAKQVVKGHDMLFAYAADINHFVPLAREKDIRGKRVTIDGVEYWIQEDAIRKEFGKYGNLYYEEILQYRDSRFKEEIDQGIRDGKYTLVKKSNGLHIIGVLRRVDEDASKFYSVLKHLNADGLNTLREMGLGDKFSYPKPVSLIKELIKGATFFGDREYIILDFFAGSGTTAQAVLELNREDHKRRRFILCTDNSVEEKVEKLLLKNGVACGSEEWEAQGICQSCTYPRIGKVIRGYVSEIPTKETVYRKKITLENLAAGGDLVAAAKRYAEENGYEDYTLKIDNDSNLCVVVENKNTPKVYRGIPANLKYYRTDFIPRHSSAPEYSINDELLKHIAEMVQLEHGVRLDGVRYILVLSDEEADCIFADRDRLAECRALYISAAVLLTGEQQQALSRLEIPLCLIPDYYFEEELLEAGER